MLFGHFWLFWPFGHIHSNGHAPNRNASPTPQYQNTIYIGKDYRNIKTGDSHPGVILPEVWI